jgi:hypothetical protein
VAGDDAPALVLRAVAQLHQQPRLAHAGIAAQQHDAGAVEPLRDAEQLAQLLELGVAPDEGATGVCCHGLHHGAQRRQGRVDFGLRHQ